MTSPHRIDSHLHLWDLSDGGYAWNRPESNALHRTIAPDEAEIEVLGSGIDDVILVQAEDSSRDTHWLLDIAATHGWVAGVVGWVRLDSPDDVTGHLDRMKGAELVGIRHLVHDDPRDDFLELPRVRRNLSLLAERGLAFDVPDAWPRHLDQVAALADDVPDLRIVVDHLGKPPRGRDDFDDWEASLRRVAQRPRIVAKLSGLQQAGAPFTATDLRRVVDIALDAFGPDRLMWGSDWPMPTALDLSYADTVAVAEELLASLSADEQSAIWSGTATAVYLSDRATDTGADR